MEIKIALVGLGNVGKEFIKLIEERRDLIENRYGINVKTVSIIGRQVSIHDERGLNLNSIINSMDSRKGLQQLPYPVKSGGYQGIKASNADIVVEATPTDLNTGEPGLTNIKTALSSGKHVVSLTKGPFVVAYSEIMKLAARSNLLVKFSGATAAALPTMDVADYCLAGTNIKRIEGILNGTTNYILTRMTADKIPFKKALETAKKLGIAEPDPTLDIKGYDTAAKLAILCNAVYGTEIMIKDMPIEGIDTIDISDIHRASQEGLVYKLLGRAFKEDERVYAEVRLVKLPQHHPLASVNSTTKAIRYETDTMGEIFVTGGASSPTGAAAAALKDTINIARELTRGS